MGLKQRAGIVLSATMWVACGGNSHGAPDAGAPAPGPDAALIDAAIDSPPPIPHHAYVVNQVNEVPTTQAGHTFLDLGLDLGSPTSATRDGKIDNVLGQALGALAGFFDVQGTINREVRTGAMILLVDLQAPDLTTALNATLAVRFGADPMPTPCIDPQDQNTCGQHLKGTGTFALAANAPIDAPLTGSITNGTFASNAGEVTLAIGLGDPTTPIALHLIHARVQASVTADQLTTAKIGGLVTQTELTTNVMPAVQRSVTAVLAQAGCHPDGDPEATPACGCTAPTQATQVVLSSIDGDDGTTKDCKITVDELLAFPPLKSLLKVDSCSQATCAAPDAYSIGAQVTAVHATFPQP